MAFLRGTEEYYQKFIELQEKLRQSEEDRLKLEIKFNEMVQVSREEEQAYYRKLRSQYKHFLEQDRRRQERNERIIRLLERIESRAAMLAAKTERFELLRKQYQAYLRRIFENMNQQNVSDKAEAPHLPKMPTIVEQRPNLYEHPAIRKVLFNDEKPNYKADIVKEYLNSLSKPETSREDVLKAARSSTRVPAATSDFSDTNGSNLSYCDLDFPQYALSSSNIADEIVSSLSSRPPPTNTRPSKVDFKKSKDHFNEDDRFCGTKLSGKFNTNPTDEVEFLARSARDFDNQRHPQHFNEFDEYDKKYELKNLTNNENKNALRRNVTFNDDKSDSKHDGDRFSIGGALNTYVANKNIRAQAEDLEHARQKKENRMNMNQLSKQNLPKQTGTFGEVLEEIKDDAFNYTRVDVNNRKFAKPMRKSNIDNETHDKSNYGTAEHIQEQANLAEETEIDRTISPVLNEEKPIIFDNVEQTKLNIGDIKYEANANDAGNNNENNEDMQQYDEHRYDESEGDKQNVHKNYQPIHPGDKVEEIMPNLNDQSKLNDQDQMQYDEHGQVGEYESNGTANGGDILHSNYQEQYNSQEKMPEQTATIAQGEQPNQYNQKSQEDDRHYEKPNEMDDQDHHIQYDDKDRQMQYDEQGQQPQYDESNVTYKEPLDHEGKPIQYGEDDECIHYDQNSKPIQYDEHIQAIQNDEYSQPIQIESNNYEEEPKRIDENKYQEQYDDQGQSIQQTEYDESRPPVSQVQYDENVQSAQSVLYDENGQPIQPIQYDENKQAMQYEEKGQAVQPIQYDENGQAIQPIEYDENGQAIQPIQYDENGQAIQPIQYDETGQPVQFDENGQPVQPIQYDENGQPITYYPQYDENGQPIQQYYENDASNQQYDENGQPIHQYGDNGQPFQQYDESGQVIPQYDETHQPEYDENGQPIYQYDDPNSQYYQDGQEYEQQYDENGQPIQLDAQVQEEQASNANYQDDVAVVEKVSENISETATEKREDVQQNEPEKQLNVMDILDTDTESTKQETKVSNDSDFDFSNN